MKYHARLRAIQPYYFWNLSRDEIISEVVFPFIAKQVTYMPNPDLGMGLINFAAVIEVHIARTAQGVVGTGNDANTFPDDLERDEFWSGNNCTEEILNQVRLVTADDAVMSQLQRFFAPIKPQAFVVMRFGDPVLDSAFERVLQPVLAEHGLSALRIDRVQDSQPITDQILDNLASSTLVIAELSGERPNCYYEAGFAQALGKEVILLIREGERVHFDLQSNRFIVWKSELDLTAKLRQRLEAITSRRQAAASRESI